MPSSKFNRRGILGGIIGGLAAPALAQRLPFRPPGFRPGFSFLSTVGGLSLVATRASLPSRGITNTGSTGSGTATQIGQWHTMRLSKAVRYVTLRYGNFISDASVLSLTQPGLASLSMRVGVGVSPYSTINPGYVNGDGVTRDLTLAPGDVGEFVVDLGSVVASPTVIRIQVLITYASVPTRWPGTDVANSDQYNEFGTALTDRTLTTSWSGGARNTTYVMLPPLAIYGSVTDKPLGVAIVGDSISSAGNNDTTFAAGIGWAQRGLTGLYIGDSNVGAAGATLSSLANSPSQMTLKLGNLRGVTHAICALGRNDFASGGGGPTASAHYANMMTLKAKCDSLGIKLIPGTLAPMTDSTNTTYNNSQENATTWTNRRAYNDLLRSSAGVGYGYFDAAASFQNPSNIDLWRTDLGTPTSDGIHPNTVLHTQAATDFTTAINAGLFS